MYDNLRIVISEVRGTSITGLIISREPEQPAPQELSGTADADSAPSLG